MCVCVAVYVCVYACVCVAAYVCVCMCVCVAVSGPRRTGENSYEDVVAMEEYRDPSTGRYFYYLPK